MQLGKKTAFQCPTNLLYYWHVRWEDLSLSTARALSRSLIVFIILDSKNSGHPGSQCCTWNWEKNSPENQTDRNILFITYTCQLWYALTEINNSKLFGPFSSLCFITAYFPKRNSAKGKKSPRFILTTHTHKYFSWCQYSIFSICCIHTTRSRLEIHYLLKRQCRQLTQKRRECHLQIYVPLPTELRPGCTASPAALAGRGQR